METALGLILLVVIVVALRSAWRSSGSAAPRPSAPPPRHYAAAPLPEPTTAVPPMPPRRSSPAARRPEYLPESTDDAFAVGFVLGRHLGQDRPPQPAAGHDADALEEYVALGDDDWDGADGGDPDGW